jgi:hypothetical protein
MEQSEEHESILPSTLGAGGPSLQIAVVETLPVVKIHF